eukprot:SAG31_NODE_800_length_12014_cov_11.050608_1_plen_60_part_00
MAQIFRVGPKLSHIAKVIYTIKYIVVKFIYHITRNIHTTNPKIGCPTAVAVLVLKTKAC